MKRALAGLTEEGARHMLRITVELLPLGDESRARVLSVAEIANDGTGTLDTGNYVFTLSKGEQANRNVWRQGAVRGFPRRQLGVWDLLYRALQNSVAERNP